MLKCHQVIFNMFLILEFLIYLFFISFWIYSLLDSTILYTNQGGKLGKYMKKYNLKNMSCSFESSKRKSFFIFMRSPMGSKCALYCFFATTTLTAIKLAFTYNFLFSQVYIIEIFDKKIDIAQILGISYFVFKVVFYLIYFIFYFVVIFKFLYFYYTKKNKKIENIKDENVACIGKADEEVVGIPIKGLYQNVLITGSIGSGKTSSAITNILEYLIINKIPGVILDVKGNFINQLRLVMDNVKSKMPIKIITPYEGNYNPIDLPNIPAYEVAHRIKKVLTMLSEKVSSDSYWLDKAEGYIKDFIVLIRSYNDYVSFEEIHKLCIDKEYLNKKIEEVIQKNIEDKTSEENLFNITCSISNLKNEYLKLDDRTKNIISSEITRVTDIFTSDYKVCNNFCKCNEKKQEFFDGITIISMNIGENAKLAKAVATYVKLNFQSEVLRNINKENKFFLCDEYQEFCNEEDAHFFSISREFKCINVVAMQSYSSLKNALKDENASNVILQNFINKIWLRNDDVYTVYEIIKQLGKEIKNKTNISLAENTNDSKYNFITKKFNSFKSGITESYTMLESLEEVLDASYFTNELRTFEAVCMISDGMKSKLYKKVTLNMWKVGKNNEVSK